LRIVTDSVKDCYAALGIIHQTWSPVPGASRTSSRCRGPTATIAAHVGHQRARHAFEVQIRTIEQHRIGEEGVAAHWKYKEGRPARSATIATSNGCDSCSCSRKCAIRRSHPEPKVELYPEEVYTFTPKGS